MEFRVTAREVAPIKVTDIEQDLTGVPFPKHEDWTNIGAVTLTDVDFSGQSFPWLTIGGRLVRCRLDRTKIRGGTLGPIRDDEPQTAYLDCSFDGARIGPDVALYNSRFERCTFTNVRIRGWQGFTAEFIDCVFSGELRDCWFTGSTQPMADRGHPLPRSRNVFSGNDFRDAKLIRCQFDFGIDIAAQRWPTDPDYLVFDRFHERVRFARSAIARWPDDTSRETALQILAIMCGRGMADQDAQILRRSEWLDYAPDVQSELFRLLEADPTASPPRGR